MDDKKIEALAREIREGHEGLNDAPLEKILSKHMKKSGLDRFISSFTSPTTWVAGVLSLTIDGFMPESQFLKLLSGITIGASIDVISDYLGQLNVEKPIDVEPIVKSESRSQLYSIESSNVVNEFVTGVIDELKEEGYFRPVTQDKGRAAVFRAAKVDRRLMALIS